LGVQNGNLEFKGKREFFRVSDATSVYDDGYEVEEIWFPPPRDRTVAVLTGLIETDVQLDFNFEGFPYDSHELRVELFLPKKHKDKMYELDCDPYMRVESERIKDGILEVKPDVKKRLFEWNVISEELSENKDTTSEQSALTMRMRISRFPQYYVTNFILRPGVFAALACVSTFIPPVEIGNRLSLLLTVVLTLTSINYTSSDSLPALPYSTALSMYHDACHYLVYVVIAHNISFFLYASRCSRLCAAEPTSNTAAGTVDPTMAACVASADAPCAAAAEVADVAATVASRWCSMCGYNIVVDYWILLDLDDFVMSFIFAYWIYWNRKWFATRVGATPTPAPPPPKDWYYRDDEGTVQGPFDEATIAKWYSAGYLPAQLIMREAEQPDTAYKSLADLTQAGGGKPPFVRALRLRAKYEAELVAPFMRQRSPSGTLPVTFLPS